MKTAEEWKKEMLDKGASGEPFIDWGKIMIEQIQLDAMKKVCGERRIGYNH